MRQIEKYRNEIKKAHRLHLVRHQPADDGCACPSPSPPCQRIVVHEKRHQLQLLPTASRIVRRKTLLLPNGMRRPPFLPANADKHLQRISPGCFRHHPIPIPPLAPIGHQPSLRLQGIYTYLYRISTRHAHRACHGSSCPSLFSFLNPSLFYIRFANLLQTATANFAA